MFFKRKPATSSPINRFDAHADILQCMARTLSRDVIEQIQRAIQSRRELHISGVDKREFRINIRDVNYESYMCYGGKGKYTPETYLDVKLDTSYLYAFGDSFGMESISPYQWKPFMDALYPHFETVFNEQFARTISEPNCSVSIFSSTHYIEEFDVNDKLIRHAYPCIKISFKIGKEVEKPILKKW